MVAWVEVSPLGQLRFLRGDAFNDFAHRGEKFLHGFGVAGMERILGEKLGIDGAVFGEEFADALPFRVADGLGEDLLEFLGAEVDGFGVAEGIDGVLEDADLPAEFGEFPLHVSMTLAAAEDHEEDGDEDDAPAAEGGSGLGVGHGVLVGGAGDGGRSGRVVGGKSRRGKPPNSRK